MDLFSVYRQTFLNDNMSFRSWDDMTMYLYYIFFISVFIFSMILERKKRRLSAHSIKSVSWNLLIWYVTLLFGLRGVNTGADTIQYYRMYEDSLVNYLNIEGGVEPGYLIITHAIGLIVPNSKIFMYIISALIVWLVMETMRRYQASINICISLVMYIAIFYFQAFNVMRIYLSAAILLYFIGYLLDGKYKNYLFVILFCTTIHMTSIVMLLPLFATWMYRKNKKYTIIGMLLLILSLGPLSLYFADYIQIARYASYLENAKDNQVGVGFMLYFEYLPFFYLLYCFWKYKKIKDTWTDLSIVLIMTGFFVRLLAYYVPIAGRLYVYFIPLFVIILPYYLQKLGTVNRKLAYRACFLSLLYAVVRLHMYFNSYLSSDGIMPYTFVWND